MGRDDRPIRDARRARRRRARSRDWRRCARHPDEHDVQAGWRRRAARWLRIRSQRESDARGARERHRGARERHPRGRVRLRAGRDAGGRLPLRPGRPAADERRRVWRHVASGRQGLAPLRDRDRSDRSPRPRRGRRGVRSREAAAHGLDRDPVQPTDEGHRHQRGRATGGSCRGAHRRRQHVRDAVPPAAARASEPTSCSIRPRSTSAATRTWSAD